MKDNAVAEELETTPGRVEWHSSEEEGGPDVGILVGLGNGKAIWLGEMLDSEGPSPGLAIYDISGRDKIVLALDYDGIREMLEEYVAPALRTIIAALKAQRVDEGGVS